MLSALSGEFLVQVQDARATLRSFPSEHSCAAFHPESCPSRLLIRYISFWYKSRCVTVKKVVFPGGISLKRPSSLSFKMGMTGRHIAVSLRCLSGYICKHERQLLHVPGYVSGTGETEGLSGEENFALYAPTERAKRVSQRTCCLFYGKNFLQAPETRKGNLKNQVPFGVISYGRDEKV